MKPSVKWLVFVVALSSMRAFVNSVEPDPQNNQLVIVESEGDDSEEAHVEEVTQEKRPVDASKIFKPTGDWQAVQPDHIVLPGLHIRMNLQTGLKEAKLLDGDDGAKYRESVDRYLKIGHSGVGQAVIPSPVTSEEESPGSEESEKAEQMREHIMEALKNIKSEDGKTPEELSIEAASTKKKFRSYEELKKDFKDMNLTVETDSEILTRVLSQYQSADSDDDRVTFLEDLEYLVHQYDNAINFIDMGGLQHVVKPALNSTSSVVRQEALHLLGSAVQSNPKVQIAAVEAGLVQSLIKAVAYDTKEGVSRKAIYALSCLVRGFPYGQQVLMQHGGFEVLRRVFDRQDWQSLPLQLKVVSLLHDLLMERAEAEGDRLQQLARLNINEQLAVGDWCPAVSSLLAAASFDRRDRRYDMGAALRNKMPLRPDHDTVDKVVSAMGSMVEVCRHQFYETLPLLRHLANTYDDLAYKEQFQDNDDGGHALFRGLSETIQSLVKSISVKKEL